MAKTYVVKEWSSNLGEWYTVSDPYPTMAAAKAAAERRQEQDSWQTPAPRYEAFAAKLEWEPCGPQVARDPEDRARAKSVDATLQRALDVMATPRSRRATENGKRRPTPTAVELEFATGRDAREFRRLLSLFDGRAGRPSAPDQYHEYVLPDAPEHTPRFFGMLDACSGKIVRQARMSRQNPAEATATTPTPFEGPSPYRVIVLTMHRKSGPKQLVVECDYRDHAVQVAERERGKQTNRRDNAIVRIDALRDDAYAPLVQWTFRGEWKREMQ